MLSSLGYIYNLYPKNQCRGGTSHPSTGQDPSSLPKLRRLGLRVPEFKDSVDVWAIKRMKPLDLFQAEQSINNHHRFWVFKLVAFFFEQLCFSFFWGGGFGRCPFFWCWVNFCVLFFFFSGTSLILIVFPVNWARQQSYLFLFLASLRFTKVSSIYFWFLGRVLVILEACPRRCLLVSPVPTARCAGSVSRRPRSHIGCSTYMGPFFGKMVGGDSSYLSNRLIFKGYESARYIKLWNCTSMQPWNYATIRLSLAVWSGDGFLDSISLQIDTTIASKVVRIEFLEGLSWHLTLVEFF